MNCQECRSLVERFLDNALTGFARRKVNLHLSRCADCRGYFDRRKQNQALAYRALNDALAGERLPEGFAERFLAAHIVPERRFRMLRFGRLWKVAAALAAMVSFVGLAAVVIAERHSADLKDAEVAYPQTTDAAKGTEASEGTEHVSIVSSDPYAASIGQPKEGEQSMTMRKPAMAAIAATLASAPLAAGADGGGYTSASYVQEGLVAQWDGIDNAGTGTHDASATVWKDLKGSCDMALLNNGESWVNGKALYVNGAGAAAASAAPRYTTIEVVYKMTSGACMFVSGLNQPNTTYYLSRIVVFSGGRAIFTSAHSGNKYGETIYIPDANAAGVHSLSAVFGGTDQETVISASMDGVVRTQNTTYSSWYTADGVAMVGDRRSVSSEPWTGEIYAIRLYDRALSVGELAANQKVDASRFGVNEWYRYITSGDPVSAATAKNHVVAEATPSAAVEARYRTQEWSDGIALDATDTRFGMVLQIR